MPDQVPIQTGRGIEGIAHLFLSQSAKEARPLRQRPQSGEAASGPEADPPQADSAVEKQAVEESEPFGIAVLADHLGNHWTRVHRYGEQLADQYGKIAVVNVDQCEAGVVEIIEKPAPRGSGAKPDDDFWKELIAEEQQVLPAETIAETEDFFHALHPALREFARDYAEVILHIDKSYQKNCRDLLGHCAEMVVLCSGERDDIIETYKTLKWLAGLEIHLEEVFLFICDVPDSEAALDTYNKLSQTCRNFLHINLQYAGCSIAATGKTESKTQAAVAREPDVAASVQPKEEVKPKAEPEPEIKPVSQPVPVVDAGGGETRFAPQRPMPHGPICVAGFPNQDTELADILQLALPGWLTDLPAAFPLPLRMPGPLDPSARVIVDATGRLHIMLASLTGSHELLSRACQARKWLSENLNLIIGSCPQVKIDRSLAAGLILIAPPPLEGLQNGASQIREFTILLKQLYLLLNDSNAAILIL